MLTPRARKNDTGIIPVLGTLALCLPLFFIVREEVLVHCLASCPCPHDTAQTSEGGAKTVSRKVSIDSQTARSGERARRSLSLVWARGPPTTFGECRAALIEPAESE